MGTFVSAYLLSCEPPQNTSTSSAYELTWHSRSKWKLLLRILVKNLEEFFSDADSIIEWHINMAKRPRMSIAENVIHEVNETTISLN